MMSLTLNADDLPGIQEVFTEWWRDSPDVTGSSWLWFREEAGYPEQGEWCALPLATPMARDLAVRYTASKGHDCSWALDIPEALAECCRRVGRGEEPLIGALGAWVEGSTHDGWTIRTGWDAPERMLYRVPKVASSDQGRLFIEYQACRVTGQGWRVGEFGKFALKYTHGDETGDEGKRLADEAARAAGWWLL